MGLAASGALAAYLGVPEGLIPPLVSETLPGAAPEGPLPSAPPPKAASKAKDIDPSVLKFVSETFAPGATPEPGASPSPPGSMPARPPGAIDPASAAKEPDTHERDVERKAMIEKDWEDRARRRARGGVSITMYSTKWCGVCTRARAYMDEAHIAYVERDVEADAAAAARARALNRRGSVPTFDIDGTAMIGFSPAGLERAIERAAAARASR